MKQELRKMSQDRIRASILGMETRWRKCISVSGQYFEGQGVVVTPEDPLHTDSDSQDDDQARNNQSSEEEEDTDDGEQF